MAIKRKAFASAAETLGDRQVRVICSTSEIDRVGEIVVQEGLGLEPYLQNPVVLWGHDPEQPIARAISVELIDGQLMAQIQFPPEGISCKADEIYGLVKAGILNTVSIGFDPIDAQPMDPTNPKGPLKYVTAELLEISFVSIPANRGATVVARQHRREAAPAIKSLYDVGTAAYVLSELGWLRDSAQFETDIEGDASQVPAMLGQVMQQLGAALIAMTQEEVAELLAEANATPEVVDDDVPVEDADYIEAGASAGIRKFRAGLRLVRRVAKPGAVTKASRAAAMRARAQRRRDAGVIALG